MAVTEAPVPEMSARDLSKIMEKQRVKAEVPVAPSGDMAVVPGYETEPNGADKEFHGNRLAQMKAHFDAQPKERIRVRQELGEQTPQVNGYTFRIQAGQYVMVPKQIADMLRESDII